MKLSLFLLGALMSVVLAVKSAAAEAPGNSRESAKPKTKPDTLKNGDFSSTAADGAPEHWKAAYPTGTFAVVKDGSESFLRVEVKGEEANAGVTQSVPVPRGALTAFVRGRMRGKPGKSPKAAAQLVFWPKGAPGPGSAPTILTSQHSVGWKTETRELPLPPNTRTLEVSARCVFATGRFDFDDIEVKFR